jgi:hypothetical protein
LRTALALTLTLIVGVGAALPPAARADGDPASGVLAGQALFLPADAALLLHQQQELTGLLRQAEQRGVRLRVAVIASRSDLGSVGALWRQPSSYARFLDQELSLVYKGPLLVVMPNGLALAGEVPAGLSRDLGAIAPPGRSGTPLGSVVLDAGGSPRLGTMRRDARGGWRRDRQIRRRVSHPSS